MEECSVLASKLESRILIFVRHDPEPLQQYRYKSQHVKIVDELELQ